MSRHADYMVKGRRIVRRTGRARSARRHLAEGLGQARIQLDMSSLSGRMDRAVLILIVVGAIGLRPRLGDVVYLRPPSPGLTEYPAKASSTYFGGRSGGDLRAGELSQGATEQAASLEETSASMEEMSSMTRQNAEHSHAGARADGRGGAQVTRVERRARPDGRLDGGIKDSSRKVAKSSRRSTRSRSRPTSSRSTRPSRRRAPAKPGWASRSWPTKCATSRSVRRRPPRTRPASSRNRSPSQVGRHEGGGGGRSHRVDHRQRGQGQGTRGRGQRREPAAGAGHRSGAQAVAQMESVTQATAATAEESAAASEELSAQAGNVGESSLQLLCSPGSSAGSGRMLGPTGLSLPSRARRPVRRCRCRFRPDAEDEPPLESTGTYGMF